MWDDVATVTRDGKSHVRTHQYATSHAQYTINAEYWHAEAAKWRTAKIQQLLVQQQQANGGAGAGSSLALAVEQQVTALIEAISRD